MKGFSSLVCAALAFVLMPLALHAEEAAKPAPDQAAVAAARDLMDAVGISKQFDGLIASMTKGFDMGAKSKGGEQGEKASKEFDDAMKHFASYKEDMLTDFAKLYAETFTAAEMKEVADFYRSGAGAKFIANMPAIMKKGSEIGMKYAQKMMQDAGQKPPAIDAPVPPR